MYTTKPEQLWIGNKGSEYMQRSPVDNEMLARRAFLFSKVFQNVGLIKSVAEFGCDRGQNFDAIKIFSPDCKFFGIDINEDACKATRQRHPDAVVVQQSVLEPIESLDIKGQLVLTAGLLIHVPEKYLPQVYKSVYDASTEYVLFVEYYNPTPVEIVWHGESGVLFKRDFAGEFMDAFPDARLVEYGFGYHRDNLCDLGDATWFLMRKMEG